jgi:hypothetical protein
MEEPMTTTPGIHRDDTAPSTTVDEGKKVAGVAAEEAQHVAGEAKDQVRRLVDETRDQALDQATTQRDRLVDTLRTFGDDLDTMASNGGTSGLAAEVARQAADRVRSFGSSLDGREPGEILDDLRGLARRRPGMFLLGALTAGVVVGRLARGAASSSGVHAGPSTSDVTAEHPVMTTPSTTYPTVDPLATNVPTSSTFEEPAVYQDAPR